MRTEDDDWFSDIPPGDSQTDIEDALGVMGGGQPLLVPPQDDAPEAQAVTDTLIVHYVDADGQQQEHRVDVRGHVAVSVDMAYDFATGVIYVYGHHPTGIGPKWLLSHIKTRGELTPGALVKQVWLAQAILDRAEAILGDDVVEKLLERDMSEDEMAAMLRQGGL